MNNKHLVIFIYHQVKFNSSKTLFSHLEAKINLKKSSAVIIKNCSLSFEKIFCSTNLN